MAGEVNQRNAQALHEALIVERARVDALISQLAGTNAALTTLRSEVETLRKLVLVQRAGTGPSVRSDPE